jgi:hypothetical protein
MKGIETFLPLVVILCGMALAASGQGYAGWKANLTEEIRDAHDCEVSFLSHVIERDIKGRAVIMAKAHCEDNRAFDAIRQDEGEMFTFTECRKRDERHC